MCNEHHQGNEGREPELPDRGKRDPVKKVEPMIRPCSSSID
jgi:hypothetical protein